MNPTPGQRWFDPSLGVAAAFKGQWDQQRFQDLVQHDFQNDCFVVKMTGNRDYLCSVELRDEEIVHKSGAWDEIAPVMGMRHEYAQSRDAWDFIQAFDALPKVTDLAATLLSREREMDVPLFPPFEPEYVNEVGQTRRLDSAMIREDYKRIINHVKAVAPIGNYPRDKVFTAWSLTSTAADYPDRPIFHGRCEQRPSESERELWLEFNPTTPAGASMIVEVREEKARLIGTYEWNGHKLPFSYSLQTAPGRYAICSDEWHHKLGARTLVLLAFDLVANYDFWPHLVAERVSYFNRADKYLIRDLVLPYSFRIVDPAINDRSYHVKGMSRTAPIAGKSTEDLETQLSHLDKARATPFGELAPGEAFVMYPGSSLLHRVMMRNVIRIKGKFVRLVPDETGDIVRQFRLSEYQFVGKSAGVYVKDPGDKSGYLTHSFTFACHLLPAVKFKYQSGESNAIEFELFGKQHVIFRGIWKTSKLPRQYLYDTAKKDAQLPLFGFYINPAENTVFIDSDIIERIGGYEHHFFPSFTTMIPHSGTYLCRERMIATRGLPFTDFVDACVESGMARALRSRIDMNVPIDDLDCSEFVQIPGVKDDLYERAFREMT